LPVDVGANLAGLEHCRDVPLFPIISAWERSANRLKRLLNCVGVSKLLGWFLLFLATMASSDAEDRRLAKDGGEVRILRSIRLLRAMQGSNKITSSASANGGIGCPNEAMSPSDISRLLDLRAARGRLGSIQSR
jgi:hypothetical protein